MSYNVKISKIEIPVQNVPAMLRELSGIQPFGPSGAKDPSRLQVLADDFEKAGVLPENEDNVTSPYWKIKTILIFGYALYVNATKDLLILSYEGNLSPEMEEVFRVLVKYDRLQEIEFVGEDDNHFLWYLKDDEVHEKNGYVSYEGKSKFPALLPFIDKENLKDCYNDVHANIYADLGNGGLEIIEGFSEEDILRAMKNGVKFYALKFM